MMKLRLRRLSYLSDRVLGDLYVDDVHFCRVLELPWLDNQRKVSCIPAGEYKWALEKHPEKGAVLRLSGVPSRSGILVHSGNSPKDSEGCILVGQGFLELHGSRVLTRSNLAMRQLSSFLLSNSCVRGTLVIEGDGRDIYRRGEDISDGSRHEATPRAAESSDQEIHEPISQEEKPEPAQEDLKGV